MHDTPKRAAQPNSHTQQPNAKPLAHAQLSNTFWSMPNVTFKKQEQILKYRTDTIHTDKHTKRFSYTTRPATCPLCGGSDSAPHTLLRCNNHTLKRMHINRHHHAAVSLCGEGISKGWAQQLFQWMLVTVKSYLNLTLNLDIKRNIRDWVFPTQQNKTFQLDIKAIHMACWLCPLREEAGIWIPNRSHQRTETYIL